MFILMSCSIPPTPFPFSVNPYTGNQCRAYLATQRGWLLQNDLFCLFLHQFLYSKQGTIDIRGIQLIRFIIPQTDSLGIDFLHICRLYR